MDDGPVRFGYELTYLAWSVPLLIVYVLIQAATGLRQSDLRTLAGPRDRLPAATDVHAGRSRRAVDNFLETYPAFVALALVLAVTGRTDGLSGAGAALWFWSRIAYLPLYVLGVPWVRSAAWGVSLLGLLLMFFSALD